MPPLFIFGTTELGRLAEHYMRVEQARQIEAFLVDDSYYEAHEFVGRPVIKWSEFVSMEKPSSFDAFAAIGYRRMRVRKVVYDRLSALGANLVNILSRHAYISPEVSIGRNNFIMPGAVVEPGVCIGDNNVVWSNVTLCHDTTIGSHNFIAANTTIGGHVEIGEANFFGFGAVVLQNRRIGNETLIGAQAHIRTDTRNLTRYLGMPARACGEIDPEQGICVL